MKQTETTDLQALVDTCSFDYQLGKKDKKKKKCCKKYKKKGRNCKSCPRIGLN